MGFVRFIAIIVILCFVASPSLADEIGVSNQEVRFKAEPVLDNILDGLKANNYTQYSKDFDETLKESISNTKFLQTSQWVKDFIGTCSSREYLGFLKKGEMTVILWKAKCDKSEDDVLIRLVMTKRGDRYLVTGIWFQ